MALEGTLLLEETVQAKEVIKPFMRLLINIQLTWLSIHFFQTGLWEKIICMLFFALHVEMGLFYVQELLRILF